MNEMKIIKDKKPKTFLILGQIANCRTITNLAGYDVHTFSPSNSYIELKRIETNSDDYDFLNEIMKLKNHVDPDGKLYYKIILVEQKRGFQQSITINNEI